MATPVITNSNTPPPFSSEDSKKLLPGTTAPDGKTTTTTAENVPSTLAPSDRPFSSPGPMVNNAPSTVTIYSPSQLRQYSEIDSLINMMNAAFSLAHEQSNTFPAENDRLRSTEQYLSEVGEDPTTFTFVLTGTLPAGSTHPNGSNGVNGTTASASPTDTETGVLATCAAMRYHGHATAMIKLPDGTERKSAFRRVGFPDPEQEVWELRHLAVNVGAQKQGLAGLLMKLTEEEVIKRFRAAREDNETSDLPNKLDMYLTTMRETNEGFYAKRGYSSNDVVQYEKGYMDSRAAFSVMHMSKTLAIAT